MWLYEGVFVPEEEELFLLKTLVGISVILSFHITYVAVFQF